MNKTKSDSLYYRGRYLKLPKNHLVHLTKSAYHFEKALRDFGEAERISEEILQTGRLIDLLESDNVMLSENKG